MDKDKWFSIWKQPVKYSNAELAVPSSDICILIDNSLSMNKKKLEEIKAAAIEFIFTLTEEDKIAVVSFDAYNGKQVVALNKNKENAINAIKKIHITTSSPRSVETTTKGLEMAVKEFKTEQSKNGRYILLFYDDDMKYNETIIKTAKGSNIHLFAVNVTNKEEAVNIQKMILNLGGYYYNADNQKSIYLSAENANNILKTGIDMKDTDGDGLFDIYEKKGIRVSNGQLVKTDYKNKDSDQDGLNDFKELNASRIKTANSKIVSYQSNIKNIYLSQNSNSQMKDSDNDDLWDVSDPYPSKAHDIRFKISSDINRIPVNKDLYDAKKTADASYNKDPNQKIAHKLKLNGYKINARLNALGGYPMSLPNASKFINHFIENTGKLRKYDAKELLETDNAKKYYQKNMNALLKACEEMTMDKDTIFIISTREMKKAKKFFACNFSSVGSKSTEEKDWWFSVGNADVGMVAKCTRNGKQYNIELRYIVQDMYDWEEGSVAVGGLVTDGQMYALHYAGLAREYESRGTYKANIKWSKGNRYGVNDKSKIEELPLDESDDRK